MPMMSRAQYEESLKDGRKIYAEGELVDDLQSHPQFKTSVKLVGDGYEQNYQPGDDVTADYYKIPRSKEDLHSILEQLSHWDMVTVTTSQGLLALLTAAARMRADYPEYADRIEKYFNYCKDRDLRCVQAITDAKGDRRAKPGNQSDPDAYTRIVERRADGVVIRGSKLHISSASVSHELIVMPTKAMHDGEEDYSIACAVPVGAPGVSIVNTSYAPREREEDFPVSAGFNMPEGFVILDDVFVPNERIFLAGETEYSANFAHALGLWERLGGTAHMVEYGDTLTGLAQLIAEANGAERINHIREKIAEMVIYSTMVSAGLEAAIANAAPSEEGWYFPSELYTNAAKHYAAADFSLMVRHLHDIAGGGVVTAPSMKDFDNPDVGDKVRKYMGTKPEIDGKYRAQLFHTIRDYTADAYGGWQLVTMLQSGGGLYAQRLVARKHYDMEHAKELALELAGLDK